MTLRMAEPIELDVSADVRDHGFARPEHVGADAAVMSMLFAELHRLAAEAVDRDSAVVLFFPNKESWHRRIIVPSAGRLLDARTITSVGFFGRVRDAVDPDVAQLMSELGAELADDVLVTPGVIGYSTHLLADERNYANLVLVESPQIIGEWRQNATHMRAVDAIAPSYYEHLRIYNGSIELDERGSNSVMTVDRVKYWDYRTEPVWHAMRSIT